MDAVLGLARQTTGTASAKFKKSLKAVARRVDTHIATLRTDANGTCDDTGLIQPNLDISHLLRSIGTGGGM
jgi:hypothetical protein